MKLTKSNSLAVSLAVALVLLFISPAHSQVRDDESDPMIFAMAAADRELFDEVMVDRTERPEFRVHHDWDWLDGTLMSGVEALYDRLGETNRTTPRYLDYIEAWGEYDPGSSILKPIDHGDRVCAGYTYMWLYERSGKTSDHLDKTDDMIDFVFTRRLFTQLRLGYWDYWMRFWNDDIHMVPPFLARRGRLAGDDHVWNGKDARVLSMEYLRAYTEVLQDPDTGLYWHDVRSVGEYMWGRGNGWAAAGMTKTHEELIQDPDYEDDAEWIREQLVLMAETLKDNRNVVGTWNADVLNREEYTEPESSGSAFFTYMIAYMINRGYLERDEYLPVVLKSWNFLKRSLGDEGDLMRVQPVGRGPIKADFEFHSETYGVGAYLLAAVEMSKLGPEALAAGDEVECIVLDLAQLEEDGGAVTLNISELRRQRPDFPASPREKIQPVISGHKLLSARVSEGKILISGIGSGQEGRLYLFYQP